MKKLTQADFQERRDILAGEMGLRSIAIIATSKEAMRNRDADYKFRADSSFFYLTGFAEPEAVAVIETFDSEEDGYSYSLFCRERDREMEIWNGYRAGVDGARASRRLSQRSARTDSCHQDSTHFYLPRLIHGSIYPLSSTP